MNEHEKFEAPNEEFISDEARKKYFDEYYDKVVLEGKRTSTEEERRAIMENEENFRKSLKPPEYKAMQKDTHEERRVIISKVAEALDAMKCPICGKDTSARYQERFGGFCSPECSNPEIQNNLTAVQEEIITTHSFSLLDSETPPKEPKGEEELKFEEKRIAFHKSCDSDCLETARIESHYLASCRTDVRNLEKEGLLISVEKYRKLKEGDNVLENGEVVSHTNQKSFADIKSFLIEKTPPQEVERVKRAFEEKERSAPKEEKPEEPWVEPYKEAA